MNYIDFGMFTTTREERSRAHHPRDRQTEQCYQSQGEEKNDIHDWSLFSLKVRSRSYGSVQIVSSTCQSLFLGCLKMGQKQRGRTPSLGFGLSLPDDSLIQTV